VLSVLRLFSLGIAVLLLFGCQGASQAVEETVRLPVQAVGAGVRAIGKGVEGVGRTATEGVVGRLLTDRSRAELLREHRELSAHMGKVEGQIIQGRILLSEGERGILQGAKDGLAAVSRQLEPERIPLELGLRVQSQLDKVREAFQVLRQRHPIPAYAGFVATR
jgi:hypothetical protein